MRKTTKWRSTFEYLNTWHIIDFYCIRLFFVFCRFFSFVILSFPTSYWQAMQKSTDICLHLVFFLSNFIKSSCMSLLWTLKKNYIQTQENFCLIIAFLNLLKESPVLPEYFRKWSGAIIVYCVNVWAHVCALICISNILMSKHFVSFKCICLSFVFREIFGHIEERTPNVLSSLFTADTQKSW